MIEKIILDYLKSVLDVPVDMEKPSPPYEETIVLEKTGSSEEDHLYNATIAIQSYAPTLYRAAVLNEAVKKAMKNLVILPEVTRCRINSDYNFTNTITKEYRYQAVFDIKHY